MRYGVILAVIWGTLFIIWLITHIISRVKLLKKKKGVRPSPQNVDKK